MINFVEKKKKPTYLWTKSLYTTWKLYNSVFLVLFCCCGCLVSSSEADTLQKGILFWIKDRKISLNKKKKTYIFFSVIPRHLKTRVSPHAQLVLSGHTLQVGVLVAAFLELVVHRQAEFNHLLIYIHLVLGDNLRDGSQIKIGFLRRKRNLRIYRQQLAQLFQRLRSPLGLWFLWRVNAPLKS